LYVLFCWSTPQVHMNGKVTLKLSTKSRQLEDKIKIFLGKAIAVPCSASAPPMTLINLHVKKLEGQNKFFQ
jgi:hypothetical protein